MPFSTHSEFSLPLPIPRSTLAIAQQFANEQPTPQKATQIQLNTLAVSIVNDYLQLIGIPTDLTASDCWNPITRLCADVADLVLPNVGRLECRPVSRDRSTCYVPPEVWDDRAGYVVVQINEELQEAIVLGFTPTVNSETLSLRSLRSPEDLIDHLHELRQFEVVRSLVSLNHWFQGIFESGWQSVESLLNPSDVRFAYRGRDSAIDFPRRAKLIDLGIQLAHHSVALVIELRPQANQQTEILLQVHPTNAAFLPPQLHLSVLDDANNTFLEVQSRNADNYIQLQFSGDAGEQFRISIALEDARAIEEFVI
ncbi:DUF1822 family protein [Phormidesmis sp. 146-12]